MCWLSMEVHCTGFDLALAVDEAAPLFQQLAISMHQWVSGPSFKLPPKNVLGLLAANQRVGFVQLLSLQSANQARRHEPTLVSVQ